MISFKGFHLKDSIDIVSFKKLSFKTFHLKDFI